MISSPGNEMALPLGRLASQIVPLHFESDQTFAEAWVFRLHQPFFNEIQQASNACVDLLVAMT